MPPFSRTNPPRTLKIKLGKDEFTLTLFATSRQAIVYVDDERKHFAKTGGRNAVPVTSTLADEAMFTRKAVPGLVKAYGIDELGSGVDWLVTLAAKGWSLQDAAAFKRAKEAPGNVGKYVVAERAARLTVAKAYEIFQATFTAELDDSEDDAGGLGGRERGKGRGISHGDLTPWNAFFDDEVTRVETLIDWGKAQWMPTLTPYE
ncbi:APH domain-containing protein [Mycena chlorophos]|uniref:APH domain-containing protein n=1 Tax=Mycena chlorophos TaxID=658473 RepID=A0A8H6STT8_MYCCL|nr:APH domain-containing protein [Mycena chlorophos]